MNITLIDLQKTKQPNITLFDAVIIGGSIHAGMMQRKVTKFLKEKEDELTTKKVGLFLCCMHEGELALKQFETAFSEGLRKASIVNGLFGGEFLFGKMNFIEKMIIKKMKGDTIDASTLKEDEIKSFANRFLTITNSTGS